MKKLKHIIILFICFLFLSWKIYATESSVIITDGNYLREINGVYYGKKQLDEAKVDASDLHSNSKYWLKQYYKYNFDYFINRMQEYSYKKYIYQSLYYSIKLDDAQEVTWVTDFLWADMNYAWISQNNELRIYFDSFYNQIIDIDSGIVTHEWKYEDDSYVFTPEIIHISKWWEVIDMNFQLYLPKIMIENQEEIGIILPDDNDQVVVHFEHQTGSNIADNSFYKFIENENNILENTNAIFRLDVTNKWYDGQRLNFIFKGAYDLFLLYETSKNIFIKSSCNTDEIDYFSWSSDGSAKEIKSYDGYGRGQYIKQLDLEFTRHHNWTWAIVEIPYTYTSDRYGRNTLYFTDVPLGVYTYKIKNLKSTYSHICEEVYGITKPDNFDVINSVLENEKKIFFQDKTYWYSDDFFQIFPPGWSQLWQKTSISSWNFDFSWEYGEFSFMKKFDVTLMNSQKENILSLGCIAPENMTEEKIIENIDNYYYISDQLDACKEDISEWLSNYFHSSGKIEFPWIKVNYEDIFWVTHNIFSRFTFMPDDIPFIKLREDAFDKKGQYFYFDLYNISMYDETAEVFIIDENDQEIPITINTDYYYSPSWEENYFHTDSGNELFIKNSQSFKKIIIKFYDNIIYEKDFSLEKNDFLNEDLNPKSKIIGNKYAVDHLFSEKIGQNEDILFWRKIYIKRLKYNDNKVTWYNVKVNIEGTWLWEIDPTKLYVCSDEVFDISTISENLNCKHLNELSERIDENDIVIPEDEEEWDEYEEEWDEYEDGYTKYRDGATFYEVRQLYLYGVSGLVSPDFQKLSVQFQINTFQERIWD